MTQTLLVVVLFVGAMAMLPWLVKRVQQRQAALSTQGGAAARVLSAVAVGPQQRVVTVEVGPEGRRVWLVLGVTAQNVQFLHAMDPSTGASVASSNALAPAAAPAVPVAGPSFSAEMAQAREAARHAS